MPDESTEVVVARMDERVSQLVDNVRTLTEAVTALTKEGARIDGVAAQVSALQRAVDDVWKEIGRLHDKISSHQQQVAKSAASGMFDIAKLLLASASGAVAAHILSK